MMKSIILIVFALLLQKISSFTKISTVAHYVNTGTGFNIRYVLVDE